ncbi:hypothetical protein ACS7SF_09945 [Ralstonia sp. 25C]
MLADKDPTQNHESYGQLQNDASDDDTGGLIEFMISQAVDVVSSLDDDGT